VVLLRRLVRRAALVVAHKADRKNKCVGVLNNGEGRSQRARDQPKGGLRFCCFIVVSNCLDLNELIHHVARAAARRCGVSRTSAGGVTHNRVGEGMRAPQTGKEDLVTFGFHSSVFQRLQSVLSSRGAVCICRCEWPMRPSLFVLFSAFPKSRADVTSNAAMDSDPRTDSGPGVPTLPHVATQNNTNVAQHTPPRSQYFANNILCPPRPHRRSSALVLPTQPPPPSVVGLLLYSVQERWVRHSRFCVNSS
jgi:hypothetical protein